MRLSGFGFSTIPRPINRNIFARPRVLITILRKSANVEQPYLIEPLGLLPSKDLATAPTPEKNAKALTKAS